MTAGGWMYIGPQGIVHGTFNTLLNAGRLMLGIPKDGNLRRQAVRLRRPGRHVRRSGQGGRDRRRGLASSPRSTSPASMTRYTQGWVEQVHRQPGRGAGDGRKAAHEGRASRARSPTTATSWTCWSTCIEKNVHIDLLSDQTSCHVPYDGGYCPQGLTFEQRTEMLDKDPEGFCELVDKTLRHHFELICKLHDAGHLLLRLRQQLPEGRVRRRRHSSICKNGDERPGRLHLPLLRGGHPRSLPVRLRLRARSAGAACPASRRTWTRPTPPRCRVHQGPQRAAIRTATTMSGSATPRRTSWSSAPSAASSIRMLCGRMNIALKFNEMVRNGEIGPVMLGRDHHDTGGTDSPFRETSNIKDGSNIMADMAVPVLRRQRGPRHEPGCPAQRRRRRHRQGHQRRLRHGAGRLRAGG